MCACVHVPAEPARLRGAAAGPVAGRLGGRGAGGPAGAAGGRDRQPAKGSHVMGRAPPPAGHTRPACASLDYRTAPLPTAAPTHVIYNVPVMHAHAHDMHACVRAQGIPSHAHLWLRGHCEGHLCHSPRSAPHPTPPRPAPLPYKLYRVCTHRASSLASCRPPWSWRACATTAATSSGKRSSPPPVAGRRAMGRRRQAKEAWTSQGPRCCTRRGAHRTRQSRVRARAGRRGPPDTPWGRVLQVLE